MINSFGFIDEKMFKRGLGAVLINSFCSLLLNDFKYSSTGKCRLSSSIFSFHPSYLDRDLFRRRRGTNIIQALSSGRIDVRRRNKSYKIKKVTRTQMRLI